MKNEIITTLKSEGIHPMWIHEIFLFGSWCYGIQNPTSDWDFNVVANNSVEETEIVRGDFNIHIMTPDRFMSKIVWCHPQIIECLLWSKRKPIIDSGNYMAAWNNNFHTGRFRHAVSHISSNSWVKAKKKILQGDLYIGQKSLYHSLRIPMYAIQYMRTGNIYDWACANDFWYRIKEIEEWVDLKSIFKPIRNSIMTTFRELCPKDENEQR